MQSLARAQIRIDDKRFELIQVPDQDRVLFAEYQGGDQFFASGLFRQTTARELCRATTGREDLCVIVAKTNLSRMATEERVIIADGKRFYVQTSLAGTPLIFERIGWQQYVLISEGRSGSPRTLSDIAQDFELEPGTAFFFAEFVGSAE